MMHEPKKSDPAVVAVKPTNKAGSNSAAEPVEPRAGAEGNADQQSTHRTQIRARVSQAPKRVRQTAQRFRRQIPEVGAECDMWRSQICGPDVKLPCSSLNDNE